MFDFLEENEELLTEEEIQWNKLWDLWEEEKVESPYQELMTYQSEINNGGHSQYFTNMESCSDLEKELSALHQLLSPELRSNLQSAYEAYLILEETEDAGAEAVLEQCDDVFYESEEEITRLLEAFSKKSILTREPEVHPMRLRSEPFEKIKSGAKTIELRLWDEKRQPLRVGDTIVFTNTATGETITRTVLKLHRFANFEELYQSLPLLQCGYTEQTLPTATARDMEQYYAPEEQAKYGVVGIELSE